MQHTNILKVVLILLPELKEVIINVLEGVLLIELIHKVHHIGFFRGFEDLLVGSLAVAVEDVLVEGVVEDDRLLQYQPHLPPQVPQREILDRLSIDQDHPVLDVIESQNQLYHSCST